MSALLALAGLVLQGVFLLVIVAAVLFAVWVLWDCMAGPSAQLAAEHRAAARSEVGGR